MAKYSIKDLERLSGIKAHTIRIWEQRYELLTPKRTDTNIRYYDDEQLKHLLNVSLLVNRGFRISKVSKFDDQEFRTAIESVYEEQPEIRIDADLDNQVNGLIVSMIELNERKFQAIFASVILQKGFQKTIERLIIPFLGKVGILWGLGQANPAQEHFISNLIRQKVITAIDGLELPSETQTKYMLFLPEGELHEIGLLLAYYLLKQAGKQVIYLGQNVPFHDLENVFHLSKPQNLVTFLTASQSADSVQLLLDRMADSFPKVPVLIAGSSPTLHKITLWKGQHMMQNPADLLVWAEEN